MEASTIAKRPRRREKNNRSAESTEESRGNELGRQRRRDSLEQGRRGGLRSEKATPEKSRTDKVRDSERRNHSIVLLPFARE